MSVKSATVAAALVMTVGGAASAQPASGQPTPAPFAPRVKPGSRVFVIDWTGAEREGQVLSTGSVGLELDEDGSRTMIAKASIARIEKTDRLLNGAIIGAAVSVPLGVASCGEAASKSACYVYGIAACAGLGALIDWARHGRTVVYRGEKPQARRLDWSVAPARGGFAARVTLRR